MKYHLIFLLFFLSYQIAESKEIKEIVLLNSYHNGFPWTDSITNGVIDGIGNTDEYRVFIEYMDFKRFQHKNHFFELSKLYKYKYKNSKIDGIICADNYAFQFFLEKGDSIWDNNIPVTFCGVNNIDNFNYNTNRIKGVREDIDTENTIKYILKLQPDVDTLVIITDNTLSGKLFYQQVKNTLITNYSYLPYITIDGSDFKTLHTSLNKLIPQKKAIILLCLFSNINDIPIQIKALSNDLFSDINIPVYSYWDFLLDDIIVGGSLIYGYQQGFEAAKILSDRIIKPDLNIADVQKTRYNQIYDFKVIQKYGLNQNLLPTNATIINKPISIYQKYKKKLIYVLTSLIILLFSNFLLISNIIRRNKIQLQLIESEKRLELALESANEGLWDIMIDKNAFVCNNNFAKLLGYDNPSEIDLNTDNWKEYIYKPDIYKFNRHLATHMEGNTPLYSIHLRLYLKDKNLKWFTINGKISERDINGIPKRLTGTLIDISSQKEFEHQLQYAKEKAEESDRLKSSFLANMSHEIRTPMNAILGFSDILLAQNLKTTEKEAYLEQIKNSGENLLNIINDIIDISKIESGQLVIRNKKINLHKLLNNINYTVTALIKARKKNIRFFIDIQNKNNEIIIYSDPFRLEQVLLNLFSNAIKFTTEGEIRLEVSLLDNNTIRFNVIDTGEGINPQDLNIIFERFRQAEKTSKLNTGTGLGLSITKSLVELMGGKITVESKVNVGTSFYITLPIKSYKIESRPDFN